MFAPKYKPNKRPNNNFICAWYPLLMLLNHSYNDNSQFQLLYKFPTPTNYPFPLEICDQVSAMASLYF